MYDYSKLRGRIKEKLGTEEEYARRLKLSKVSISSKLNGKVAFTSPEIARTMYVLDFTKEEIGDYFFSNES